MKELVTLFIIGIFIFVPTAEAHPGRTDGSGGHTCRTNCENWGLSYGEYHDHSDTYNPPPVEPDPEEYEPVVEQPIEEDVVVEEEPVDEFLESTVDPTPTPLNITKSSSSSDGSGGLLALGALGALGYLGYKKLRSKRKNEIG